MIGHKEWTNTKIDPRGFAMDDFRTQVATRLGKTPAGAPGSGSGSGSAKPAYQPFPGAEWFRKKPRSAIVTAMGKRLVAVGCSAYAQWQRRLGYTGSAADGWPGAKSWAALRVPYSS